MIVYPERVRGQSQMYPGSKVITRGGAKIKKFEIIEENKTQI